MKTFFLKSLSALLSVILLITQMHNVSAKPTDFEPFFLDEKEFMLDEILLNKVFGQLNNLDMFLTINENISYNELLTINNNLLINVSENAMLPGLPTNDDPTLGIPSFWWGCFLGWVGILMVYIFTDNDKSETKKALNGCLVSGGAVIAVYVMALLFYGGAIAATSYQKY